MKIGIMGSGAVGSFFGSFLSEAGHDVTYIARGAHLAEMKKNGLTIMKENENITIYQHSSILLMHLLTANSFYFV